MDNFTRVVEADRVVEYSVNGKVSFWSAGSHTPRRLPELARERGAPVP